MFDRCKTMQISTTSTHEYEKYDWQITTGIDVDCKDNNWPQTVDQEMKDYKADI